MLAFLNNLLQTDQVFIEANDIEQVKLALLGARYLREKLEFLAKDPLFQVENAIELVKFAQMERSNRHDAYPRLFFH